MPPVSAYQCTSMPHNSAHSELPFNATHQCCQSVPPNSASQCHLIVPVSAAYQCHQCSLISTYQ
ncbi:unnamed protein product [Staurois parvus]|uniref:Uncharacterized protein n=1 Tax=Staurois parvus TaxID=386267 RepID=A0ABN9HCA2_9NEOB|nr:unnamed protein product [Staurois parvus]